MLQMLINTRPKGFISNLFKIVSPSSLLLGLLLSFTLIYSSCEKRELRGQLKDIKESIVTTQEAHTNQLAELKFNLEAKIEKIQALNKALLLQLDTKAEQVADVKTYITDTSKTICSDVAGVIAENVVANAIKYNVPVATIVSVMEVESHFNFQAVGNVDERGLMQVRHDVWGEKLKIKSKYDLHNIAIGVEKGVQVLDISLKECEYNLKKAIRQFNSGSTSRGSSRYVANVMKVMSEYAAHTSLRQVIKDKQKKEVEEVKANGSINDSTSASDDRFSSAREGTRQTY